MPSERPPPSTMRSPLQSSNSEGKLKRRDDWVAGAQGAPPGTLVVTAEGGVTVHLIDYCAEHVIEKDIQSIDEAVEYLIDDTPSITWVDVRGLGEIPAEHQVRGALHAFSQMIAASAARKIHNAATESHW